MRSAVACNSLPENLKVLILSTPKTGNTWLKYLLSAVYDLPVVQFPMPELRDSFDYDRYDQLGPRWIAHQHFPLIGSFIRWAQNQGVVLITTIRHPGDTLVSMYHYVQNYAGAIPIDPEAVRLLFSADVKRDASFAIPFTKGLEIYVRKRFFYSLNYSIAWLASGLSYGVRYEDLWHTPIKTLQALTEQIHPVPLPTIENAVKQCHIDRLRATGKEGEAFYRAGGVGGWRASLPSAVIHLLRQMSPYPLQFKWLNYDLPPREAGSAQLARFNSYRCPPLYNKPGADWLTAQIFCSFVKKRRPRLRGKVRSIRNEFYSWLNAAANDDPGRGRITPIVTNLGACLYRGRPDLQKTFPDLYGRGRAAFSHWFVEYMPLDYPELDMKFVTPICESWVRGPRPKFSPVHIPRKLGLTRRIIRMIVMPSKIWSIYG